MHLTRAASALALLVAACDASPEPPVIDAPSRSVSAVDTGRSPAAEVAGAGVMSAEDGQPVTTLPRLPGPPSAEAHEALLEGTLVAEDGCLWVVTPHGSRYVVIWPEHVELDAGPSPARVTDGQSGVSARVGGPIRLGGGEAPGMAAEDASVPSGCRGPVWLASGIVAAAN